jgi:hypothetical protein
MSESYDNFSAGIVEQVKTARSAAARSVNSNITATYWEIGRRIVESEQGGEREERGTATSSFRALQRTVCLVRQGLWHPESRTDEELLPGMADRKDFADTVCKIFWRHE